MKKRKWIIIAALAVFLPLFVMIIGEADKKAHQPPPSIQAARPKVSEEDIAAMKKLGILKRIVVEKNRAYVNLSLWNGINSKVKEDFSAGIALYCSQKNGGAIWVDIYDDQSGKKLSSYSPGPGLEVF